MASIRVGAELIGGTEGYQAQEILLNRGFANGSRVALADLPGQVVMADSDGFPLVSGFSLAD